MTYEEYRAALIEGFYQNQLETLMSNYRVDQPTVILLPGIMGSQLERTNKPYPDHAVISDIIWMDIGIAFKKDALGLEIDGQERDLNSYVVAAYGALSFGGETPYNELKDLALKEHWNYAVFGYDWRRPLAESSEFFKTFVRDFRQRVIDIHGPKHDPLPNLTIVCHSMGGLVATEALRDQSFSGLGFRAVLTFGTPFYGSASAQNAFYVGMPGILNDIYKAPTIVRLISSFAGAYSLMFLPKEVYDRDGGQLGLSRYPEYDPNGNEPVDPYDSDPAVMRRWPKDVKSHRQYLVAAKQQLINIASPINANVVPVFFNVRSSLDRTTAVAVSWNNIDGDKYVPGSDPSPLTGVGGAPGGDGTVPAWSAWHVHCRSQNRHELKRAKEHGKLMEHPEVLSVVKSIVRTGKLPSARMSRTKVSSVASKRQIEKITKKWVTSAENKKPPPPELFQKSVLRAIVTDLMNGPKPPSTLPAKRSKRTK